MSIIDDAADIIRPHIRNAQQEPAYSDDNDDHDIEAAAALDRAGMLTPKPQIIRTAGELEALDPGTLLICLPHDIKGSAKYFAFSCRSALDMYLLPAVVIATGDQVRAARKDLEADQ